ncbi:hypothetical protein BCR32DRAFT_325769 [Anaeromyces robustus]|uniref:F-box domain-containing protein n=1 Tax=Anaeromyces robustus TaxID=1754192 RepID=A0A1Y1XGD1_9FUNG|nr:hypothetical protein BCR32DRAFT_325769 [Anaeromyces robustus]|eukprot:ORX84752.1 hypothetical protein BCR32DRAFT_325769 [Anaeromyces robustus]
MEKIGLLRLPYQILIYEISKYLELEDFLNYTSTCKYLNDNKEKADIWKKLLYSYSKENILFVENEETPFNKYKTLKTLTHDYNQCIISHDKTHWAEKDDEKVLIDVWWLQIVSKFNYVPDGKYIPEFQVKFAKRTFGLDLITFNARVLEVPIEYNDKEDDIQQNQSSQENNESQQLQESDGKQSLQEIDENQENNEMDPNEEESINKIEIMATQNKFNRRILQKYRNNEWCIIECPEIIVDRSKIDSSQSKISVELEIKDTSGIWKKGISFKGMRLRKVED